jgi:SAM-dependent methyltransferase
MAVPTVICDKCGLVYTWPVDMDALRHLYQNEYAYGLFGAERYPPPSPWERQRATWIADLLDREPAPRRLLEIGCNAGALLSLLARAGFQATGLEPGLHAATFARQQRGLQVTCGFWEEVPVEDGGQDAVVLINVLEHFHSPLEALAKVRRALRPGGLLFCEIPNLDHERGFFIDFTWRGYRPTPEHLYCYSERSITRLLLKSGFTILDVHRYREVLQVRARRCETDAKRFAELAANTPTDSDTLYDSPDAVARMLLRHQRDARLKWPLHVARKAAEVAAVKVLPGRAVNILRSILSRRNLDSGG